MAFLRDNFLSDMSRLTAVLLMLGLMGGGVRPVLLIFLSFLGWVVPLRSMG